MDLDLGLDPGLSALRPLGGFSVLHTSRPPSQPWRPAAAAPLAHAYAPGHGNALAPAHAPGPGNAAGHEDTVPEAGVPVAADPLGFRVRKVAAALGTEETRVAASVAHQGLAARLWSVTLACAALYGAVPGLDPRLLCWDPDATAPDDLWLAEVRPLPGDAATVADVVLTAHLAPLTAAVHTRYGVASGLLWGNAASALAGAGRELVRWARRHGRTDTATRARSLTADLFAHPLLTGTGALAAASPDLSFRRRSCCLYYRVPGAGVCGDCCFSRPPGGPRSSPGARSG